MSRDHEICHARPGDQVTIQGGSSLGLSDLAFTVERVHRYEWEEGEWFELVGESAEGPVGLEWEQDEDGLWITLGREDGEHRLDELGLTERDMIRFDEHQSSANVISFQGKVYRYEKSHETGYSEHGGEPDDGFYLWDFEREDEQGCLSIEKWEGEDFEVYLGEYVDPARVRLARGLD